MATKDHLGKGRHQSPRGWLPSTWFGWLVLIVWVALLALFLQFAVASLQELEIQAAILGWILVVILLVGGLMIWSASLYSHPRHR